jgi:outer membrane protein OmpA-like peptidoglycan-associated protein
LNSHPELKIQINGHTDNIGNETTNQTLSTARAKAVADYLQGLKISPSRISYRGFGKSKPIGSNETEQGRRNNRRTEFEISPI